MNYREYLDSKVSSSLEAAHGVAGKLKAAYDLADLLDSPLLAVPVGSWRASEIAEIREEIFHDFCALCVYLLIPVPAYEHVFFEVNLPKIPKNEEEKAKYEDARKQALDMFKQIDDSLSDNEGKEAEVCRALAKTFCLFLTCNESSIKMKNILAVINSNLVKIGLNPVRPDYQKRKVPLRDPVAYPEKEVIVAIFDDNVEDIIKTARALIGWPNIKIVGVLHESIFRPPPDKRLEKLNEASEAIKTSGAHVVLMDQGLTTFDGSDLIRYMQNIVTENLPVFVANTGGSPEELEKAGALDNCDKGRNLRGVAQAISLCS